MTKLILTRHGQSVWNAENRFTGWVDVDLSNKGILEAEKSGQIIKDLNIKIDISYTSYLKRAIKTLTTILQKNNLELKFNAAWQLNERHYGALTGLNKIEMAKKIGEKKVHEFRRSWDMKPDALSKESPHHPSNISIYKDIPEELIPSTESLKDTYDRVVKFFEEEIQEKLRDTNILISAHGNSIRALCKKLFKLDNNLISNLEIPTGNPLLIKLDNNLKITKCEYLDKKRAKDLLVF
jgi:2,3-bisphosphoglycerate-dependent phosphoglycerate mutase